MLKRCSIYDSNFNCYRFCASRAQMFSPTVCSNACQAAPVMENDEWYKRKFLNMLDTAEFTLSMQRLPEYDAKNLLIVFCVTCLERADQLMCAMLVNVCLWWSLRKYWRLVIVTFADDEDLQEELGKSLRLAIETGNVVLASGGKAGVAKSQCGHPTDRPSWMPAAPSGLDVAARPDHAVEAMPYLHYWHASMAKNSSHMAAIFAFEDHRCCLVNLGCDQLVPVEYVSAALKDYVQNYEVVGFCLSCAPNGSPTGTLGYRAADFVTIGGYDEAGPPCSGEDVDIRNRMVGLSTLNGGVVSKTHLRLKGKDVCGIALPHDLANISLAHDRGFSKVKNCDPEILLKFLTPDREKLWDKMQEGGLLYWRKEWSKGVIKRNTFLGGLKHTIGSWWVVTARTEIPPEDSEFDRQSSVVAAVSSQEDEDMQLDGLELRSPRHVPQTAQSSVWLDIGMTVQVFIIGAAELKWKIDSRIASLGRSNRHVTVCSWLVSFVCCLISHHSICVFVYLCRCLQ